MPQVPPLPPVVILSTADFDAAIWTNKQHLASGLAGTRRVIYIESLGLRQPTLRLADLRRVVAKLRRSRRRGPDQRRVPEHLTVVTPRVLPFHRFRAVRWINGRLVSRMRRHLGVGPDAVLWSFSPMDYGLSNTFAQTIYHSVDFLHEVPGIPRTALLEAEADLIGRADVVIASSTQLQRHLREAGAREVLLWQNVAQTELFQTGESARENRAIFAGNLTPTKVDYDLLRRLLDAGVRVDFAGPRDIDGTTAGDKSTDVLNHPNARYLGLLSLPELSDAFSRCKLGLIPYVENPYTRGVFPMKVYEYLAAGLSVLATPIESLRELRIDGLTLATQGGFVQEAKKLLVDHTAVVAEHLKESASAYSWTARIRQATQLLDEFPQRATPLQERPQS